MVDREKVIDILGACGTDDCDNCPLNGGERCSGFVDVPVEVLMDAIALLREQEPRVLTVDEVQRGCDYVWAEIHSPMVERKCLICCRIGQNQDYSYAADLDEDCGQSWLREWDNYNKTWRCWTSRPTPDQMQETPWEGEKE